MVDSEYGIDTYKSVKISTGTVMRNPEMLKMVADNLKTKKMWKHAVEKLLYLYVPDQQKTQQMCHNAVLENVGTLNSVPDCYKNQEICKKQLTITIIH